MSDNEQTMGAAPKIYFFLEETRYNLQDKRRIRQWIVKSAENEEHTIGALNYIFTNDNILLTLNTEYLRHSTLTDIITFDMSEKNKVISGDVFISIDRARENAKEYKVSLSDEVHRLIIHGMLHLAGYKDKTSDEKLLMRQKEEFYLSLLPLS
jgi:rRNA maturation RNase YbeY